jgi:hypothetical protein
MSHSKAPLVPRLAHPVHAWLRDGKRLGDGTARRGLGWHVRRRTETGQGSSLGHCGPSYPPHFAGTAGSGIATRSVAGDLEPLPCDRSGLPAERRPLGTCWHLGGHCTDAPGAPCRTSTRDVREPRGGSDCRAAFDRAQQERRGPDANCRRTKCQRGAVHSGAIAATLFGDRTAP